MGSQKSQEETSLITKLQPNQFTVLESKGDWQVWQDRISTRHYMVFTLDDAALTDHNLQIYHFRKLNRAYLSGVQAICQDDPGLCARPDRTLLLLDDLPHSLADFGRNLKLQQGLTVLQAALAGYRIMSYLYGPLLTSPDMIRFTEAGVPKVWANQHLQRNQPSPVTIEADGVVENNKQLFPNPSISEKKTNSIRSILVTVSTALTNSFPQNLIHCFQRVRSYEEAEEVLELYCRREGIELQEWIEARPLQEKRNLISMTSGAFLSKVSSEHPIAQPNAYANTLALRNQNIEYYYNKIKSPVLQIPPNFYSYSEDQSVLRSQSMNQSHPPPLELPLTNLQPTYTSKAMVTPQPVVTETIITTMSLQSHQRNNQQDLKPPPQLKIAKVSVDERGMQPIIEQHELILAQNQKMNKFREGQALVESRNPLEESDIPTKKEISSQQFSQNSHEINPQMEENYQLVVHEITDNQNSHDNEIQIIHDKTIQMEQAESDHVTTPGPTGNEEIDLWEESMQRIANKIGSRQSSDYYRSEERDKVLLPEQSYEQPQHDITDFKSEQQLEQYIRNKYSQYFTEIEKPKIANHHHTSSLDKHLFEKKVAFAENVHESAEEVDTTNHIATGKFDIKPTSFGSLQKYTFGNIQLQPTYASTQYQNAVRKPSNGNIYQLQNSRRKKTDEDAINARYSKYVVNRSGKALKRNEAPTSQFGRDHRQETTNTYDDLRRLLKQ